MQRITIIDSHTGGEPTRVVVAGGPELGRGTLAVRREKFQRDFDRFRSAIVNEPRGSDVIVGPVTGDVAWGGNWFFLVEKHGQELSLANVVRLTDFCWLVRQAVNAQGLPEVDHVELFGLPTVAGANSRNFVQCPGKAYDRSPCGTGTSAKLACLAADGKPGRH